jgi:hypothetical protein
VRDQRHQSLSGVSDPAKTGLITSHHVIRRRNSALEMIVALAVFQLREIQT